jgi:hypothetical protein
VWCPTRSASSCRRRRGVMSCSSRSPTTPRSESRTLEGRMLGNAWHHNRSSSRSRARARTPRRAARRPDRPPRSRSTSPLSRSEQLRCEDTPEHPTDAPGGCVCGSLLLNPCAGEAHPSHSTDRRQCFFDCAPSAPHTYRLQCPDGTAPSRDPAGCGCSGRVLSPCGASPPVSVQIAADACVVTCR